MEKIVRHRYWWFLLSLLIIVPGLISLSLYGLRPSIDFSGGALWDVYFPDKQSSDLNTEKISQIFAAQGFEGAVVQLSEVTIAGKKMPSALIRTKSLDPNTGEAQQRNIRSAMQAEYGTSMQFEQVQSVGATVSQESTRSAVIAVLGACVAILIYLTVAFRKAPHPIRYGVCALIAMLHDVLVVLGIASILGVVIGLEVDALFLTALLTVISFSVHDTIVVFDRVREDLRMKRSNQSFEDVVNTAVVQTLSRSINTQLTVLFTLLALLLFGGATIAHFILILTIGLISGTYSS